MLNGFNRDFTFFANFISRQTGIKFIQNGYNWCADTENKTIYYPEGAPLQETDLGFLIHEAGHIKFTTLDNEYKKKVFKEMSVATKKNCYLMQDLWNCFEDIRVEELMCLEFRGARRFLDESHIAVTDSLFYKFDNELYSLGWDKENPKFKEEIFPEIRQFLFGLLTPHYMDINTKATFDEYYTSGKVKMNHDRCSISAHTASVEGGCNTHFKDCEAFFDWCLRSDVAKMYLNYLPSYKGKEDDDKYDEQNKKEEEENEQNKQNAKSGKGSGNVINANDIKQLLQDLTSGKASSNKQNAIKEIKKLADSVKNLDDIIKGSTNKKIDYNRDYLTKEKLQEFINANVSKMKKSISVIKDKAIQRYSTGYETGRIDNRKVFRVATGYTRVFKRKDDIDLTENDIAITLVVDTSGSMNDDEKSVQSCLSATLLAKALEQAGKPFSVIKFGYESETIKKFGEKVNMDKFLKLANNCTGSTRDFLAIDEASKELSKRNEANKIIIVFSDGETDNNSYLKQAIDKALKVAKIYAFGIMDSNVTQHYPVNKVLQTAEELSPEMIKLFKQWAGKRIRK